MPIVYQPEIGAGWSRLQGQPKPGPVGQDPFIDMNSRFFKFLLNIYPPYIGAGIRIRKVAPDFREIVVQMRLRWYNRNYFNTHFGGSLYAMVDPFFCLMLVQVLGKEYIVWDQAARIEFVKPGRGTVSALFKIGDEQVNEILAQTADGRTYRPEYSVDVCDEAGEQVARINKVLYIRKKDRRRSEKR